MEAGAPGEAGLAKSEGDLLPLDSVELVEHVLVEHSEGTGEEILLWLQHLGELSDGLLWLQHSGELSDGLLWLQHLGELSDSDVAVVAKIGESSDAFFFLFLALEEPDKTYSSMRALISCSKTYCVFASKPLNDGTDV